MKIFCIDLKSFYASAECSLRGLDPFTTPLVVADPTHGPGSIVLATSPYLRKQGVPSRCRVFSLPKNIEIIYARPRMAKYIEMSTHIYQIYLRYAAKEDIHVYSIDEVFIDFTHYPIYKKLSLEQLAEQIIKDIYDETQIPATVGIGENMFLSKVALDVVAKKSSNGVGVLNQDRFIKEMWSEPFDGIWGIGFRIARRLKILGFHTIGEIALSGKEILKKEFGIIGEEIHEHCWGIDRSTIADVRNYQPMSKSISAGQVLFSDYHKDELPVIILEMVDELVFRLLEKNLECRTIYLSIMYSKDEIKEGFSKSKTLENTTNNAKILYQNFIDLYYEEMGDYKIRRLSLGLSGLISAGDHIPTLFEDPEELELDKRVYEAMRKIKGKYGKGAVMKAASLKEKATQRLRNKLIGGHNAE